MVQKARFYRVGMVVGYRVGLTLYFDIRCLPSPAWADGHLAELAGLVGIIVEHPNQSQSNPVINNHPHPVLRYLALNGSIPRDF